MASKNNSDEFEQIIENESFILETGRDALELACCDCSLVHSIDVEIIDNKQIRLTFKSLRKKTEVRRHAELGNLLDGTDEHYLLLRV